MTEITLMTLEDVDGVHAIEEASFPSPWSRNSFVQEITENKCARYLVLREDGEAAAYAGMWLIMDEGHITNIAVRPDRRGRGYGEAITRALIQLAADSGLRFLTLECRRSNLIAQSLYHKLGFRDVGFRKRYYENNEDALIMFLEPLPQGRPENDPFLAREDGAPSQEMNDQ